MLDTSDLFSNMPKSCSLCRAGVAPGVHIHTQQQGHQRTSGFFSVPAFAIQNIEPSLHNTVLRLELDVDVYFLTF